MSYKFERIDCPKHGTMYGYCSDCVLEGRPDEPAIEVAPGEYERCAAAVGPLAYTCPDCHAPVGIPCVMTFWRARDSQFEPAHRGRDPHNRRCKRARKFGVASAVPAQEAPREKALHEQLFEETEKIDQMCDDEDWHTAVCLFESAVTRVFTLRSTDDPAEPQTGAQVPQKGPWKVIEDADFSGSKDYPFMIVLARSTGPCEPNVVASRMSKANADLIVSLETALRVLREERDRYTRVREMDVQAMKKLAEAAQTERESRKQAEAALRKLRTCETHELAGAMIAADELLNSIPQEPAEPESGK